MAIVKKSVKKAKVGAVCGPGKGIRCAKPPGTGRFKGGNSGGGPGFIKKIKEKIETKRSAKEEEKSGARSGENEWMERTGMKGGTRVPDTEGRKQQGMLSEPMRKAGEKWMKEQEEKKSKNLRSGGKIAKKSVVKKSSIKKSKKK
jgi:hypothetical protein